MISQKLQIPFDIGQLNSKGIHDVYLSRLVSVPGRLSAALFLPHLPYFSGSSYPLSRRIQIFR
jgi:hypothetical protein